MIKTGTLHLDDFYLKGSELDGLFLSPGSGGILLDPRKRNNRSRVTIYQIANWNIWQMEKNDQVKI